MLAVQDGLVELDVPVSRYLPDFSVRSAFEDRPEQRMTLRHLLSHTAGFTHEAPIGNNYLVGRASFTAHCRSIGETWLRFPVGHHYEYSNLGIDLAAYILQRRTRLSFHEFVRRRLFAPLGLGRTTFDYRVIARDEDRAIGHDERFRQIPMRVPMVGAGGVYTSVLDAARFAQLHLRAGDPLLESRYADEMCAVPFAHPGQVHGYGLGVVSAVVDGLLLRGHGGGGFGFLSDLYWTPDAEVGVAVLTNSVNHPLQQALAFRVLKALVAAPVARPASLPRAFPHVAEVMPHMVGEYVGRSGRVTIAAEGTRLVLVARDERHRLRVVSPDEVVIQSRPVERYRILPGSGGSPLVLLRVSDGSVWYRNDPPLGGSRLGRWTEFEGEYAIKMYGVPIKRVRLVADSRGMRLVQSPDDEGLWLREHAPGLFFSTMGEALDLTQSTPTYANIELHRLA
jgi:CubicO group peptidase (beta-lactamase class C family)